MHNPKRESPFVIFLKAFPPQIIAAMAVQIALINGALMIGGVFLGVMLDRQFETRPLLTLILPILGAILSVFVTYRMAMRTVKRSRQVYLDWVESQRAKANGATDAQSVPAVTLNDAH
ncbi:MAG: AtpZ/AtpI family protein [Candidatus Brachytrichaceae bacterium NZ_4S206]|jgi:F0F1-type ATP synthase assembly protein I